MRKKMNSVDALPIRPKINNRKASLRARSQNLIRHRCPMCREYRSINSFTDKEEIKNNPEDIILYENCNWCNSRLLRKIEEQKIFKQLFGFGMNVYSETEEKYKKGIK